MPQIYNTFVLIVILDTLILDKPTVKTPAQDQATLKLPLLQGQIEALVALRDSPLEPPDFNTQLKSFKKDKEKLMGVISKKKSDAKAQTKVKFFTELIVKSQFVLMKSYSIDRSIE